jgi:hypothetical protein
MKLNVLLRAAGVAVVLCLVASNVSAQGGGGGSGGAGAGAGAGGSGGGGGVAGIGAGAGGFGGGGGFSRGASSPAGSQASVGVTAVADDRANAVVVNATDETLKKIQDMVKELDQPVGEDLMYKVYRLTNADASEVSSQISSLFYNPSTSGTQTGGIGQGGGLTGSSDRLSRMATVSTLPDPRTGALIVVASKSVFPKIEDLILQLDGDPGYKEMVGFFELQNADVQDVYSILTDLFNRTSVRMQSSANSNPLLGQNNPLTRRITSTSTSSTSFGTSSTSSGGGSGGTGSTSAGF